MTTPLDAAIEKIAELTEVVKQNGGMGGLQKEELMADFQAALDAHKTALLEEMPVRRGEMPPEAEHEFEKAVKSYNGRYADELKGIAKDGHFKIGSWKLRGFDLWMAHQLISKGNAMRQSGVAISGAEKLKPVSEDLGAAVKLLTSTGSGIGDEYVPTGMATELWNDFFSASRVVSDLPMQPMPTDPFDVPLGLARPTWRKGAQGQASSAANPATAKSTLTSTEQLVEVDWTYNMDEDAVVAMMPALRQMLTLSGGEQLDAFAINADSTNAATGNINLDDANPDNDAYYLSDGQDGIRHLWIVDNTGQGNSGGGDALADADMVAGLNDLGKYGLSLNEVRIVPGIAAYFAMVGLTNVATVDKYGPQATVLAGELARYRGVPIVPSASQPLAEADGKVSTTAGNNTLGTISLYNRMEWKVGFRRGLTIEVDRNIQTRQLIMVVSFRIALGAHGTRSSATHTSGIYNFTV